MSIGSKRFAAISYKHICWGAILITSSFSAAPDESDSYEKCASITAPDERVKCYDSLAKKPSKKQNPNAPSVTRSDARVTFIEKVNSDIGYRDLEPLEKIAMTCALDLLLDETFGSASVLDSATFERRLITAMNRMKTSFKSQDPDFTLKLRKCAVNSNALPQAIKKKSEQDRSVPLIDMDDLRIDIASLKGQKVRLQGVAHYIMNMFMLKKNSSDMSPMIVDITKLQRDQHRKILQQCADIMTGCHVTVYGTVGKVSYQNGILAERIEWHE